MTEEKGTEEEGDGKVSSISLSGSRSRAENADDEWNEDYTTRCYCGLDHNDDFMIQCDICKLVFIQLRLIIVSILCDIKYLFSDFRFIFFS